MRSFAALLVCFVLLAPAAHASTTDENELSYLQEQVVALTAIVADLLEKFTSEGSNTNLDAEKLNEVITDATEWLVLSQEESGHFRYEYAPYEGEYLEDDNIVRQSGVLYELGEVARRDPEHVHDLENTIVRAIGYFESITIVGEHDGKEFRCIAINEVSKQCKLGATSLALTGILSLFDSYPEYEDIYTDLAKDYKEYILAMKKDEGGFRNLYRSDRESQSDAESSFSNGEAMVALARYYRYEPSKEIQKMLDDMFLYVSSEDVSFDFSLYLWIMAALKDMHELWPNDAYTAYAYAYTNWRMDYYTLRRGTTNNVCAYVEGIASAYSVLEGRRTEEEDEAHLEEIDYWLEKLTNLQVDKEHSYRIAETNDGLRAVTLHDPDLAQGGFLTSEKVLTQRIDYTQHCISSYLQRLVDIEGGVVEL